MTIGTVKFSIPLRVLVIAPEGGGKDVLYTPLPLKLPACAR
jgi:hypothetical protein